jgi:hypothetical protein
VRLRLRRGHRVRPFPQSRDGQQTGRIIAPHVQGLIWGATPELRARCAQLGAGLAGADPLHLYSIREAAGGFAGAVGYMVKPPRHGYCLWRAHGCLHHPGEALALVRHHRLFTHLLPYDYPDLTLSGGEGLAVLRTVVDRPFRHPPAIIGLAALALGWEEKSGFGTEHPVLKLGLPLSDLVGMNVELLSQLAQRLLAPYGN